MHYCNTNGAFFGFIGKIREAIIVILIITNSTDIHADIMASVLNDRGVEYFRLDMDGFPRDFSFVQSVGPSGYRALIEDIRSNTKLELTNVTAAWTRKTADFQFISDDLAKQERLFAEKETEHTLYSILYSLDCYWMNNPLATQSARWKGEQLKRAARMGFNIPASITTNNPGAVTDFRQSFPGDMIFKAMSSPYLAGNDVDEEDRLVDSALSTTLVDDEHMQNIDAVAEIPCHFQQYIDKKFELRVTVIGDKVFCAKIYSQDDERTRVDSRDMSADIRYRSFKLPSDIETMCRDFVHSYQLQYGALDIIVTPDDEYVFLENNPAGQFWYVQQLVPELSMMEALADCLIRGKG